MLIPHVEVGQKVTAAAQNQLIDQINANTDAIGQQGTPSAIGLTMVATGGVSGHRLVTRVTDSLVYATNNDLTHANAPLWLTLHAAEADAEVDVISYGTVEESSWGWNVGAPVFLGTNGFLTQTPPSAPSAKFSVVVGIATAPDRLFLDRQLSVVLV